MKRISKMMLLNNASRRDDGYPGRHRDVPREDPRKTENIPDSDYWGGYEVPENRFRDRRGREHYDNGRFVPRNYDDGAYGNGDRREDRINTPKEDSYAGYPHYPEMPPYFRAGHWPQREVQPPKMRKIGFSVDGEMERIPDEYRPDYRATVGYPRMNELGHNSGEYEHGYGEFSESPTLDKQTAEEWAKHMENADGTTGPHWTMEQTKQVQSQKGIDCDPVQFWIALNATYSDLCKVFKKYNINTVDAYVDFAKAMWLEDKDAQPEKLARYYQYIVKH